MSDHSRTDHNVSSSHPREGKSYDELKDEIKELYRIAEGYQKDNEQIRKIHFRFLVVFTSLIGIIIAFLFAIVAIPGFFDIFTAHRGLESVSASLTLALFAIMIFYIICFIPFFLRVLKRNVRRFNRNIEALREIVEVITEFETVMIRDSETGPLDRVLMRMRLVKIETAYAKSIFDLI